MINPIVLARVYCTIIYIYILNHPIRRFLIQFRKPDIFDRYLYRRYTSFNFLIFELEIIVSRSIERYFFHYSTQNRNRNESKGFQLKESSVKHFLRTFQFLIIFAKSLRSIYSGKILRSLVIIITLLLE